MTTGPYRVRVMRWRTRAASIPRLAVEKTHNFRFLPRANGCHAIDLGREDLLASGCPSNKMLEVQYRATVDRDRAVRIDLQFELNRDVPMAIEYCAHSVDDHPTGRVPFTTRPAQKSLPAPSPTFARPQRDAGAKGRRIHGGVAAGTIRICTDGGEPWLDVLDGRKRSWAIPGSHPLDRGTQPAGPARRKTAPGADDPSFRSGSRGRRSSFNLPASRPSRWPSRTSSCRRAGHGSPDSLPKQVKRCPAHSRSYRARRL